MTFIVSKCLWLDVLKDNLTICHKNLKLPIFLAYLICNTRVNKWVIVGLQNLKQTFFLIVTHLIITDHISLVSIQSNYCSNNLLILVVNSYINKIIKRYYLKALWDGQGKIKMYYGMPRVKKQLSRKRSITKSYSRIMKKQQKRERNI